jgi:hypothetical protein
MGNFCGRPLVQCQLASSKSGTEKLTEKRRSGKKDWSTTVDEEVTKVQLAANADTTPMGGLHCHLPE